MANFGLFQSAPQLAPPDFSQSNASGGMQDDAAQMARQQAMGVGVSPADLQMRAGLMQAQKANAAQAVSTRGNFGLAGAQHAAQTSNAGLQQNVLNQSAQMRAQEQNAAMQQYLQAATQKRAADLQAAGLSVQESIAQAQMEQNANSGNQAMMGKLVGLGIGAAEAAATGGASLAVPAAMSAVDAAAGGGAGSAIGGGAANAGSLAGGGGSNFGSVAGSMISDERAKQEAYVQGQTDGAVAAVQHWTSPQNLARVQAGERMQAASGDTWVPTANGYQLLSRAPMGTPVQEPNDQPRMHMAVAQQKVAPQTDQTPMYGTYTQYDQSGQPVDQQASDQRAKAPAASGNNAAQAFLNTLQPHAFTWADPSVAPNPQAAATPNLGIYAQDVERSPWGQAIVHDDPGTGYKTLDTKALISALAAGVGEMHRQQQDHAKKLDALMSVARGGR